MALRITDTGHHLHLAVTPTLRGSGLGARGSGLRGSGLGARGSGLGARGSGLGARGSGLGARGSGLGRKLKDEAQRRLYDLGCQKINLQNRNSNLRVVGSYERLGQGIPPKL